MWGFLVALISGALMSIQGVFNTEVTKQTSLWVSTGWVQLSAFAVCVLAWIFTGRDSIAALWQVENKYTLLGGIIGAALIGFLFALAFFKNTDYWWQFAVIGAISSVISQIGDLTASAIKRNHEIKDYGNLIPGHGGILDRFDSIIFIAPIVFYLVSFFGL